LALVNHTLNDLHSEEKTEILVIPVASDRNNKRGDQLDTTNTTKYRS
jgi:hypothetical protein